MYVCFSQLEEEEAKKRKRKNERDKNCGQGKGKMSPRKPWKHMRMGEWMQPIHTFLTLGLDQRYADRFTSRPL
jgi:hypothetical protein